MLILNIFIGDAFLFLNLPFDSFIDSILISLPSLSAPSYKSPSHFHVPFFFFFACFEREKQQEVREGGRWRGSERSWER